jgi:MoaA/NifB/PqqE/SkfB family radical SAM enzyme
MIEEIKPILMKGWDFTLEDYTKAWNDGKLLTAQIENSDFCNLNCEYCFRGGTDSKSKIKSDNEFPTVSLMEAIKEMSELGAKTFNIVGAGEPLLETNIQALLWQIHKVGATPVIATNGSRITPKLVNIFQEYEASIIIKLNTFDSALQDKLAQKKGYAQQRDNGLKLLMDAGFNVPTKDYQTRIGINSIVFQDNKNEVLDILRYCRNNNIMPIMGTFIPIGRTKNRTNQEVPMDEFLAISEKAREMDAKEYGIKYDRLLPFLGGVPCTQCSKASIYLTISGDIYDCVGQLNYFGNVREKSIKDAFKEMTTKIDNRDLGCPPRLEYWKRTGQIKE